MGKTKNTLSEMFATGRRSVGKILSNGRETPWMTIEETADYLRCSLRFLREKAANKEIPHTKFGGKALFNVHRIDNWLLSLEEGQDIEGGNGQDDEEQESIVLTKIRTKADKQRINELVEELKGFKDRFVSGLGNNLEKDLDHYNYEELSEKVYAQLSRWCHPRRDTKREKKVKPIAHEISQELYGLVIDRTKHPSYSG
jgi:excisionase family DNA binding protein